jgi:hypothetical protein
LTSKHPPSAIGPNANWPDAELKPILETMWEMPYREIAEELTDRKTSAPRGGVRNAMTVMRTMKRLAIAAR